MILKALLDRMTASTCRLFEKSSPVFHNVHVIIRCYAVVSSTLSVRCWSNSGTADGIVE